MQKQIPAKFQLENTRAYKHTYRLESHYSENELLNALHRQYTRSKITNICRVSRADV